MKGKLVELTSDEVRELAEYLIRCNISDPDIVSVVEMSEDYFGSLILGEDLDRVLLAYQTATISVSWEDRRDL